VDCQPSCSTGRSSSREDKEHSGGVYACTDRRTNARWNRIVGDCCNPVVKRALQPYWHWLVPMFVARCLKQSGSDDRSGAGLRDRGTDWHWPDARRFLLAYLFNRSRDKQMETTAPDSAV